ncbi:MAG: hypothetical protein IPL65_07035 [Lewinellaceae bacterium]|nr:hypothetical protein [Lewinellaceae bacterium]
MPLTNGCSHRTAETFTSTAYDSLPASRIFQGKGAFQGNMADTCWVFRQHLPAGYYYISCWMYANQDLGMCQEMKIVENRRTDGTEIHFQHEGVRFYLRSIVNGWGLYDIPFQVYDGDAQVSIFLQKPNADQVFYLDELLIKPADFPMYARRPGWIIRNNFWYRE